MGYVTDLFATLVRLLRPCGGVHTSPLGYARELAAELRRRRSSRVRRYAVEAPTVAENPPLVPAPRRPIDPPRTLTTAHVPHDYVPVVDPCEVAEPADIVRPFYREWEKRREQHRTDQQRLAVGVLMDMGNRAGVSA